MQSDLSPKASEIVLCTQSLLATGGYNSFSYADVSEAVRISKASIHHYFPSKAELVRTVVRQYRESARTAVAAVERQLPDPLDQLRAYTDHWAECIRDGTLPICICTMLAAELPVIPTEVAEEVRGHFADLGSWLAAVLKRGAAQGTFQLRGAAEEEAMTFMATVNGAMLSARAIGKPEVFQQTVDFMLRQLLAE